MDIVERLRKQKWQVLDEMHGLIEDTTAYEAADEIERLREILRFYADEKNWSEKIRSSLMGEYEASDVQLDQGSYARSALNPR